MDGKKKPPTGASGEYRLDIPMPAGSSLVPRPMSVAPPTNDSVPIRIDSGAPFPVISMPPGAMSAPTIRIADSTHSSGPPSFAPSLAPPPLSLRPQPASPKTRRAFIVVLLLVAAALAIVRPTLQDLGIGGTAARRVAPVGAFAQTFDVNQFQRGNMHTHTTLSDGLDPPRDVIEWYRDHGYQFLALTDHDKVDDLAPFEDLETSGFVLLPAEEVTSRVGSDKSPVHVNGICIGKRIPSGQFDDVRSALADAVGAIRAQQGFVIVNHPNFKWGASTSDIASLGGAYSLEIWSGHPDVSQLGDPTHPSHEEIWDELLARGRDVGAIGADDMHRLTPERSPEKEPLPGRAWVETFGAETTREAICDALMANRMYVSSGVAFRRIALTASTLSVWVGDSRARVEFVGNGGQVLSRGRVAAGGNVADGYLASYTLQGGESYVRARAMVEGVGAAWTQAYRTAK